MPRYLHQLSRELERRRAVRSYRAGKIAKEDLCDADALLLAAAEFHGEKTPRLCPLCQTNLREVVWLYGEDLVHPEGTAHGPTKVDEYLDQHFAEVTRRRRVRMPGPVTVHLVEVCPRCRWNFLLSTVEAHPGGATSPRFRGIGDTT